jgi:hypothetical protein
MGTFSFSTFDSDISEDPNTKIYGKIYVIVYVIITNIMVLNLLIALFSDSYNK